MKRGEVWTVAAGTGYAGKPRPAVVVQDDRFDATDSVTVCAFTTDPTDAPLFRLVVEPNERNGLRSTCRLMVDKIATVPKAKMGARVGRLDDEDMVRLNQAMTVFLGMAVLWWRVFSLAVGVLGRVLSRERVRTAVERVTGTVLIGLGVRVALTHH